MSKNNIKITKNQIKFLYRNILKYQLKGLVCKNLRIDVNTIDNYLKRGKEYYDLYFDELEDIRDVQDEMQEYEEELLNKDKEELEYDFCNDTGLNSLNEKTKNAFESWLYLKCEKEKENILYYKQEDIFDKLVLDKNSEFENKKIILLIKFYLIWNRAYTSLSGEYGDAIHRYSKSSRNANQAMKMLQTLNKDDFESEKQEQNTKAQNVFNAKNLNFVSLSTEFTKKLAEIQENTGEVVLDGNSFLIENKE